MAALDKSRRKTSSPLAASCRRPLLPEPAGGNFAPVSLQRLLERARTDGVLREDALPFLLEPGTAPRAAALLVHGFTATPWEMRPVAESLQAAGYRVLAVRLPGHGTSSEDLAGRNRHEWLAAVAEGYALLQDPDLPLFGIGLSTGGLLLACLAAQRPLAGLVLLSPFLRLAHPLAPLAGLVQFWRPFQERILEPGSEDHYYRRRPLAGVVQLRRLGREVTRLLPGLTLPVLAVGAEGDQTVDLASGLELFRRLGSRRKEYHRFGPEVPHVLTTAENPCLERLLELLLNFLGEACPKRQEAARARQPGAR